MSGRASEYKKGKMTNEERKARLKQRCMDDVASKRAKLVRSLRNAPGSVSQVGHAIVESMQSEDPGVDPDDPHAGLTEAEYQELMSSLEVALVVRGPTPPAFQLPPSQSHTRSNPRAVRDSVSHPPARCVPAPPVRAGAGRRGGASGQGSRAGDDGNVPGHGYSLAE